MRFVLITFLVCVLVAFVASAPQKKSSCRACPLNYAPICARPKSGRGADLSFGNDCVLDTYNCEHPDNPYEQKATGECPGGAGIRLS